jgi:predicted DNA-binding protein
MHSIEDMREKQLNIRLNEEETARVEALAKHYGLGEAALVRMLLKREADAVLPDPAAVRAVEIMMERAKAKAKPKR